MVHAGTYSGDGKSVIIVEGDDVLSDEGGGRGGGASDGDVSSLLIVEGVTSRSSSLVGWPSYLIRKWMNNMVFADNY